jgi:hypothetical protein
MTRFPSITLLRVACTLTLISLGLIAWGILEPMPIPIIFAMSAGQGIGTLAVLLFGIVVLRDLKPRMLAQGAPPPRSLRGSESASSKGDSEPPRSIPAPPPSLNPPADSTPPPPKIDPTKSA